MNEKTERTHFKNAMGLFAARYPSWRYDQSKHETAYWMCLQLFDLRVACQALIDAADEQPKFVPGAGIVREHAAKIQREMDAKRAKAEREKREMREARAYRNPAPDDPDKWGLWIDQGETAFERLARKWEVESKQRGIRPGENTPKDIGAKRLREFWENWDNTQGAPE